MSTEQYNIFLVNLSEEIIPSLASTKEQFPLMANPKSRFVFESTSLFADAVPVPVIASITLLYDNGIRMKKHPNTDNLNPLIGSNGVNATATQIASNLDPIYNHMICGECYFILNDNKSSVKRFVKFMSDMNNISVKVADNISPNQNVPVSNMFLVKYTGEIIPIDASIIGNIIPAIDRTIIQGSDKWKSLVFYNRLFVDAYTSRYNKLASKIYNTYARGLPFTICGDCYFFYHEPKSFFEFCQLINKP